MVKKNHGFRKCDPENCNLARRLKEEGKSYYYDCPALLKCQHGYGQLCMKA